MSAAATMVAGVSAGQQAAGNSAVAVARSAQAFEGFLKTAGRLVGVVLSEIVKYAVPISVLIGAATPNLPAEEGAFLSVVQLIGNAVIAMEQKWSSFGPGSGTQKLADVLVLVEQPVVVLFADAGLTVDGTYVTNLVNGIVALLNAQPGNVLDGLAGKAA